MVSSRDRTQLLRFLDRPPPPDLSPSGRSPALPATARPAASAWVAARRSCGSGKPKLILRGRTGREEGRPGTEQGRPGHLVPGNWGGAREGGPDARRGQHGRSRGKTPAREMAVFSGTCASALCAEARGPGAASGALRFWAQRRVRSGRAPETLSSQSAARGRAWGSAPGQRLCLSFRSAAVPPYCQSPTPSGGGMWPCERRRGEAGGRRAGFAPGAASTPASAGSAGCGQAARRGTRGSEVERKV